MSTNVSEIRPVPIEVREPDDRNGDALPASRLQPVVKSEQCAD
jgi:hypothetical protein